LVDLPEVPPGFPVSCGFPLPADGGYAPHQEDIDAQVVIENLLFIPKVVI
jgi:hypothetical protein